jgi:hypothetical protein
MVFESTLCWASTRHPYSTRMSGNVVELHRGIVRGAERTDQRRRPSCVTRVTECRLLDRTYRTPSVTLVRMSAARTEAQFSPRAPPFNQALVELWSKRVSTGRSVVRGNPRVTCYRTPNATSMSGRRPAPFTISLSVSALPRHRCLVSMSARRAATELGGCDSNARSRSCPRPRVGDGESARTNRLGRCVDDCRCDWSRQ